MEIMPRRLVLLLLLLLAGARHVAGGKSAAFVIVDGGVAWIVRSDVQLDLSVGNGTRGDTPRPFVAVGLSVRAGKKKTT